jgi:hypothetical protein
MRERPHRLISVALSLSFVGAAVLGCPSTPAPSAASSGLSAQASRAAGRPAPSTTTPVAQASSDAAAPPTDAGTPPCKSDMGCNWDDECAPKRCIARPYTGQACEETLPEPGICACEQGACTIFPTPPAVPCTSWKDCSWSSTPRLHAVSSRDVPRPVPHPVKPCTADGEKDSVCGPNKTCKIVKWGC